MTFQEKCGAGGIHAANPLCPELEKIQQEIEDLDRRSAALCAGLSQESIARRPEPGRWSIAENLIHLRITCETFIPGVDAAMAEGRANRIHGSGPFRLGLMGRFFVWYVEPPPVIRLPAPKQLRPVLPEGPVDPLAQFLESQHQMAERLRAANGLDLNRVRITSPLAKFVRMDLLAFFAVFTGHGRRHLWQAENVRRVLDSTAGFREPSSR